MMSPVVESGTSYRTVAASCAAGWVVERRCLCCWLCSLSSRMPLMRLAVFRESAEGGMLLIVLLRNSAVAWREVPGLVGSNRLTRSRFLGLEMGLA